MRVCNDVVLHAVHTIRLHNLIFFLRPSSHPPPSPMPRASIYLLNIIYCPPRKRRRTAAVVVVVDTPSPSSARDNDIFLVGRDVIKTRFLFVLIFSFFIIPFRFPTPRSHQPPTPRSPAYTGGRTHVRD